MGFWFFLIASIFGEQYFIIIIIFNETMSFLLSLLFGTAKWKTKLILVKKQTVLFLNWQVTPSRKGLQSQCDQIRTQNSPDR